MSDKPYLFDTSSLRPEQLERLKEAARSELVQKMQPMLQEIYKEPAGKGSTDVSDERAKAFFDDFDYTQENSTFKY
jgi:hypothetical protein